MTYATSLKRQVAAAIRDRGDSTVDDLVPLFPEANRGQLLYAIRNASQAGSLRMKVRGVSGGVGRAVKPAVWEWVGERKPKCEAPPPPLVPVASAWDLATARPWEGNWPPGDTGRQYRTLGGWTE